MLKRHWHYLLLLFLLFDFGYSFWHYMQFALDGDLAPVVWPSEGFSHVLRDPFGLRVLLHNDRYPAPNRFFAHFFLFEYFRHVPLWLQHLLSPLDSLYAACALVKITAHALIVYALAVAVSNRTHVLHEHFLLAAVLVSPLLQTSGFNYQMGVVDWSITYTAFYALPLALLLLFFLPFFRAAVHGTPLRVSWWGYAGLVGLALIVSFSSPTIPGTALVVCPAVLLVGWYRRFAARSGQPWLLRASRALGDIPRPVLILFGLLSALSLYSLFIGLNNSENLWTNLPLAQRYARLPLGVYYQFTSQFLTDEPLTGVGLPLLLAMLLVNAFLLGRQQRTPLGTHTLAVLKLLALFALIYLLLLPLGGYRSYREFIVRRDTILPITIGMIAAFALSAFYLLTHLPKPSRWQYATAVAAFLAVFTLADQFQPNKSNACERALFTTLAQSPAPIVRLPATCTMMDWQPLTDYRKSELNGQMLQYWGITKTPKRYYQQ
ncbi:hypothetical protein ACFQT0_25495 [Hymenobacter humi]|uniref:Glycosyltransferase RgtA/B/C/D-like domain-containing protein n=1 Tax=Hymenobacter humi TaxID=1411620 RepID=A0ABW2UDU2_9BACT